MESLFQKELARRGIPNDDPSASGSGEGPGPGRQAPPSWGPDVDVPPQLQMSRELNSEGLEGLLPRAAALIQLGLGFFLAFGPFILAVALATGAVYSVRRALGRAGGRWVAGQGAGGRAMASAGRWSRFPGVCRTAVVDWKPL